MKQMDRTHEVLLCEKELMEGSTIPMPLFLNLSFDEVSFQVILHYSCLCLPCDKSNNREYMWAIEHPYGRICT